MPGHGPPEDLGHVLFWALPDGSVVPAGFCKTLPQQEARGGHFSGGMDQTQPAPLQLDAEIRESFCANLRLSVMEVRNTTRSCAPLRARRPMRSMESRP